MKQTFPATADSTGTATPQILAPNSGLLWVVWFVTNSTNPFRAGATFSLSINNTFWTSTSLGSGDSAFGPPPMIIQHGDKIDGIFAGLQAGDQATVTLWYDEQPWSDHPDINVGV